MSTNNDHPTILHHPFHTDLDLDLILIQGNPDFPAPWHRSPDLSTPFHAYPGIQTTRWCHFAWYQYGRSYIASGAYQRSCRIVSLIRVDIYSDSLFRCSLLARMDFNVVSM